MRSKVDYKTYIRSPEWAAKRDEFLAWDNLRSRRCCVCKAPRAPGFHVHHLTYNRLGAERLKDLTLVCPEHHDAIHARHDARKRRQSKRGQRASLKTTTRKVAESYADGKRVWIKRNWKAKL